MTEDEIRSTIGLLEDSLPNPHMTEFLPAENPLAKAAAGIPAEKRWWRESFIEKEQERHPPPMPDEYKDKKKYPRPPKTKWLVIAMLRRLLDGPGIPETDGRSYKSPSLGGDVPKSQVFETDPDKTDRGTKAHKDTEKALAEALNRAGLEPLSPAADDPHFDIAWRDKGVAFIVEVKSLTAENETRQIRLAIGQVLDYAYRLHWEDADTVRPVVAVEYEPTDSHWANLCEKNGIILTWPNDYDSMLASF
jgi:hypothetical protein